MKTYTETQLINCARGLVSHVPRVDILDCAPIELDEHGIWVQAWIRVGYPQDRVEGEKE